MSLRTVPLVLLFVAFSLGMTPSAQAGLIGYWPLDGDGTAIVGTDGALINGPTSTTDRNGTTDGALAFDGTSSQYVSVPGGGGLNAATTATISMWVQWNGTQDNGAGDRHAAVLGRQNNGAWSDNVLSLYNTSDPDTSNINWESYYGAGVGSGVPPGDGTWRHVAVTVSPTGEEIYVDGISRATRGPFAGFNDDAAIPLSIGAWIGDGASYSTSRIDDVAIWDEVLSEADVASLATGQVAPDTLDNRIQPVGALTSSELRGNFKRHAANMVDGVGLTSTAPDGWPSDFNGMWLSASGDTTPTATFDLGGTHSLDSLMVFNYNEGGALTNRGVQAANLSYSTDNVTYTALGTPLSFAKATGDASNPGQLTDLGGIDARYVRLDVTSNHGDSGYTGLGEVLFFGTPQEPLPLPVDSVTSSGSDLFSGNFDRRAIHLTDGTSLVAGTHPTNPDGASWLSDGVGFASDPGDAADPELVFELDDMYVLESMKIWNYNEAGALTGRGVDEMEVLVSRDGIDYTSLGTYSLTIAPGDGTIDFSESIDLPISISRFVKFDILSNHNGVSFPYTTGTDNGFVGLSEVQFFGTAVPEPSTYVLFALGTILLIPAIRRRNARCD